ncbi:hypothetical protein SAMN04489708_1765 [Paracidovorax cattleyae]|uniref:Uncharacterized protein n=1 Tax=Paracidovorax cattleyae TaxID=80868 RepID=A0A1H0WWS1_9BURK|nr:hypothetical protein SAMN04489708_1765 [Paracidovorax cattleyae]
MNTINLNEIHTVDAVAVPLEAADPTKNLILVQLSRLVLRPKPTISLICWRSGAAASMPTFAKRPGCRKFSMLNVEPLACSPRPANERNTIPANWLKLPRMYAKAPT